MFKHPHLKKVADALYDFLTSIIYLQVQVGNQIIVFIICIIWFYVVYRPHYKVPVRIVMPIAHVLAGIYTAFAQYGMKVPHFTPSRVRLLSCNRTFNCTKANDRLGYTPIVPLQVLTSHDLINLARSSLLD